MRHSEDRTRCGFRESMWWKRRKRRGGRQQERVSFHGSNNLDVEDVTPPSLASAFTPLLLPGGSAHIASLGLGGTLGLVGILLDSGRSRLGNVLSLVRLLVECSPLRVSYTSSRLVGEELQ